MLFSQKYSFSMLHSALEPFPKFALTSLVNAPPFLHFCGIQQERYHLVHIKHRRINGKVVVA
jgi:hypothetical protein